MLPARTSPRRALLTVIALGLLSASACADWVWTPERGWHNPKNEVRGTADELFTTGTRLFQGENYEEAAKVFNDLAGGYPGSQYAKRAQFYAGESYFEAGRLYEAYESYEAYLSDYPESAEIETIVEKEYEIGRAYLNGERKALFKIQFLSLPSPKTGIRILESVVEHSPYSDFADDAVYAVAEYQFRKGKYDEAAATYRRLAHDYPESEWATKSKYQAALCAERLFSGGDYTVESLIDAREQLEVYSAEHPADIAGPGVGGQIAAIDDSLAEKMWSEVLFYERAGKLHSSGYLCRRLQTRYPDSHFAVLAAQWIGEHPELVVRSEDEDDEAAEVLAPSLRQDGQESAPEPTPPEPTPPEPTPPEPGASSGIAPASPASPTPARSGRSFVPRSHSSPGSR